MTEDDVRSVLEKEKKTLIGIGMREDIASNVVDANYKMRGMAYVKELQKSHEEDRLEKSIHNQNLPKQ